MKDITICKINESVLEIKAEDDILHNLYSRYSAYQAGYQFNPKFKCRIWDGKVHLFNIRTGILPIGFLFDVLQYCRSNNYSFDLEGITLEDLRHTIDEQTYQQQILDNMKNSGRTLRPYQDEAVRKALTFRKGILLSCTSSGKSMMLYNIIRNIRREGFKKILLIVPNILLIKQMYDDFVDYGYDNYELELTKMGGDETPDMSAPVLISTWQSLQNKSADFFEDFDAVFVDECLAGDTLIETKGGKKPIKDIKAGELVLSFNNKTKEFEYKEVLETFINHTSSKSAKMIKITLENDETIEITENHPVLTENRGWVIAGELTETDEIVDVNFINNNTKDDLSEDKSAL